MQRVLRLRQESHGRPLRGVKSLRLRGLDLSDIVLTGLDKVPVYILVKKLL